MGASAAQAAATSAAASKIVTIEGKDPSTFNGLVKPGNLDIYRRPIVHNADGSYSTTLSTSFHDDRTGLEVLIPTVVGGKELSPEDAWNHYLQTGENLGSFTNPNTADTYATALHNSQARMDEVGGNPTAPSLASTQTNGLTPVLSARVQALLKAANGKVRIVSGYRTPEQQAALYQTAAARYGDANAYKWVAQPGDSNHEKGAAVDLGGDLSEIQKLAPQFGLIAPMSWEPWHLEMSSTPQHASPQAYTTPPPGEVNPTQTDNSQNPAHIAATLAEGLMGMTNSGVGTAGNPELGNPATQGDLSDVLSGTPVTDAQPIDGPQGPTTPTTSAGGANIPTGKGNVAPGQLYQALTAAGFDPVHAAAFVSIAQRESGFNTAAHNGNRATGDDSYGLWQINLLNGGWGPFLQAHGIANPQAALQTLDGSIQALKAIYASSGMNPWGPYKHVSPIYNTNPQTGVDASGGQVTLQQLEALG